MGNKSILMKFFYEKVIIRKFSFTSFKFHLVLLGHVMMPLYNSSFENKHPKYAYLVTLLAIMMHMYHQFYGGPRNFMEHI